MKPHEMPLQVSRIANFELFLLNLRYKEGRLLEAEGNRPVLLDDPDSVWVVYAGMVDLFSVPVHDGGVAGMRRHLFRGGAGQLLCGMDLTRHGGGLGLLASGTTGTRLLRIQRDRFWQLAAELEFADLIAAMVEDWARGLLAGLRGELVPKDALLLEAGVDCSLAANQVALPRRGVVWVQPQEGEARLLGQSDLAWPHGDTFLPLSRQSWVQAPEATTLTVAATATLLDAGQVRPSLERFHALILDALAAERAQASATELQRLQQKRATEQAVMEQALRHLTTPLDTGRRALELPLQEGADTLLSACQLVGKALGISFQPAPPSHGPLPLGVALKTIARVSRVRFREVALRGMWWRADNGPLLAFRDSDQRPVALLPLAPDRYEVVDTAERTRRDVTAEVAAELLPMAYTFYRPFPDKALTARDLVRFAVARCGRELLLVLFLGSAIGLLGLVPPLATGLLFDRIIPAAEINGLLQVGGALLVIALTVGLLQVARGITLLRLQTRMDAALQAALWDRLLNLPLTFFRDYSAGSLGTRAMGISEIRRTLSGHVVNTLLTGLFSIFNLALLFLYSARLALVAVALVAVALAVTATIANLFVRYQRAQLDMQSEVAGRVLQLLTGVSKIRIAGAENQAFALWAQGFTAQKKLYYQGRSVTNGLLAFNVVYPLLASVAIFAMLAFAGGAGLSTGDFLAFNLAFTQFLGIWFMLGGTLIPLLTIGPIFERLRPILQTAPEVDDTKSDPGELTGKIEVSHVSFRYRDKGPMVLNDVSLEIRPGEFVALVGASGSGKSTLLRLLLGFDSPEMGGIYYDDQDLADLDLRDVRRQIGVVLQSASLIPGDIYSNIVGSSPNLSIEDAWWAARMSGLDQDINNMPMAMNTVISEGGGNFSGGQRQRLLIARAIVHKPRILFFDEATSALDNQTQEIVSRSLESLQATRVVIAHRLSTIINADRIYVFDRGRIVQVGNYDELMGSPGLFAELARRQIA